MFLGAKSTSIIDCVCWLVGLLVGWLIGRSSYHFENYIHRNCFEKRMKRKTGYIDVFRCEEHLYNRLRLLVGWLVGWLIASVLISL